MHINTISTSFCSTSLHITEKEQLDTEKKQRQAQGGRHESETRQKTKKQKTEKERKKWVELPHETRESEIRLMDYG